ncbi:Scr1 family TA system antitoxin-like transcriptional regulator [Lentzea atacamensis]|uniref:Scr1 family TA system antitoxin-like transcriptional regulator n=1 Tax=Lentzea atacamensis TaxID=531938 RepID=UPI003989520B
MSYAPSTVRGEPQVTFTDKWRLAYSESALSAHYFDAEASVIEAETMFGRLDEQALSEEASRQFLETVAA